MHRILHPVGQGAFFSEHFPSQPKPLNMIFDCGSNSLTGKRYKARINSSFRKDEVIDILFISHFHADHINGIEHLIKGRKVKNVVIPYLDDDARALVKMTNMLEDGYIETGLIDSPETVFGDQTRIIRVRPASESTGREVSGNDGFFISDDLSNGTLTAAERSIEIQSGTPVRYRGITNWVFVPFNYEMTERVKPFTDALNTLGLTLKDLDTIEKIQTHKKLLIKAYGEVESDLNKTSLILYSGPNRYQDGDDENTAYISYLPIFYPYEPVKHFAGCLYTGDADLNEPNLISDLSKRLSSGLTNNISTLVAPHHGAIGNFHAGILDLMPNLQSTVFSYGDNTYGHPSDAVIAQVVGYNHLPPEPIYRWDHPRNMIIRVTEDPASLMVYKFIQAG